MNIDRTKLLTVVLIGLAMLLVTSSASAVTVTHIYELNGSFADALGGPAMVPNGGTLGATGYTLSFDQGPNLSNAIDPVDYSIEMLFSINDVAGWDKLIDFKNRTSDTGLYDDPNAALHFFPVFAAAGPAGAFVNGQLVHLVATRDGATNQFLGYVNGVQHISFTDSTGLATFTGPGNIIHFLRDEGNQGIPGEHPSGFLDRVRIYDGPLSATEVSALAAGGDPPGVVPEPGTLLLLGSGAAGLAAFARRRRRGTGPST